MPGMTKVIEELNSLLHPQMDYWLASILASIFAATKAGQARMAIRRLLDFAGSMKKEYGQRLDDEFTNDATVVFERALERIKITELLVKEGVGGHEPLATKDKSAHKDLLATWQFVSELKGFSLEPLWAELNNVGERLKARYLSEQQLSETFRDQIMAVFRTPRPGGPKSNPSDASNPSKSEVAASKKPGKKPAKN